MQPQQQPDYNFIMNPTPARRRPLLSGLGGTSKGVRFALLGVMALVIVVVMIVIIQSLGGSGLDKTAFLNVLQDQSELTHLSQAGTQSATSQTLQNFSATLGASMPSEQTVLLNYLAGNHYKPSTKSMAGKELASIDTQLQNAQNSSTFDGVYTGVMQSQLKTYEADLNVAGQKAGPKGKAVIRARAANAQLLLSQLAGN